MLGATWLVARRFTAMSWRAALFRLDKRYGEMVRMQAIRCGSRGGWGSRGTAGFSLGWNSGVRFYVELRQCIDVSDGLALDLHRLCVASGVAAEIDRVPVAKGATVERALHGGDDYELLFTLPAGTTGPKGTTRIGRIVGGKPGTIQFDGRPLKPTGYDHFVGPVV